jgi:hypothetical protein
VCIANDSAATDATDVTTPAPGSGFWYLVRAGTCSRGGSYGTCAGREAPGRDSEIAGSPSSCAAP